MERHREVKKQPGPTVSRQGGRHACRSRPPGPSQGASRLAGLAAAVVLLLGWARPASAHYFWIEPGSFFPRVGASLPVELWVGHRGDRRQLPRDPEHVKRFELLGPEGAPAEAIPGVDGRTPAGFARPRAPGLSTIVYRSGHSFIELEATKFEAYLRDEGLLEIIAERRSRNEGGKPGRESFARFCKSLIRVEAAPGGPAPAAGSPVPARTSSPSPAPSGEATTRAAPWARDAGLEIEIFPEADPYSVGVGEELAFRVDLYDRPLPGRQVSLIHLEEADLSLTEVTDGSGRVRFRLPKAGRWMVATVHMRRAPEGVEGDWESLWSSLTFELH